MKRWLGLALALLHLAAGAHGKPDISVEAAARAVAAHRAGETATFRTLAAREKPDPWVVVAVLRHRGETEVMKAFAKAAATRKDTERLPAYVAAVAGRAPDPKLRAAVDAAIAAFRARLPGDAVRILRGIGPDRGGVMDVQARFVLGAASGAARRLEESAQAFRAAARGAEKIGWLNRAAVAYRMGSSGAFEASSHELTLELSQGLLRVEEARENPAGQADALNRIGSAQERLGKLDDALATYTRALGIQEGLGGPRELARVLHNLGRVHLERADHGEAIGFLERALPLYERLKIRELAALALREMGLAHRALRDHERALRCFERSLALTERPSDRALALYTLGLEHGTLGHLRESLDAYERCAAIRLESGDPRGAASALNSAGNAHQRLGRLDAARRCYEKSLELDGSPAGVARSLGNLGMLHAEQGRYAEALAVCERALRLRRDAGLRKGVAASLDNLGAIHLMIGDTRRALARFRAALDMKTELGWQAEIPVTLSHIGTAHARAGEFRKALSLHARALNLEKGNPARRADTLRAIGFLHLRTGDDDEARAAFRRALELKEKAGTFAGVAECYQGLAKAERRRGNHQKALELDARAERLGPPSTMVRARWGRAATLLAMGDAKGAAEASKRAVEAMRVLVHGHAEEQAPLVRERFTGVFANGLIAARSLGDLGLFSFFLESGRGEGLRESLGGLAAIGDRAVPDDLRVKATEARAAVAEATARYKHALRFRDLGRLKRELSGLEAAQSRMLDAVAGIQRASKATVVDSYPKADSLEEIRGALSSGEALVLYVDLPDEALALVVEPKGSRLVSLGEPERIERAARRLSLRTPRGNPAAAVKTLQRAVIEPLRLGSSTTRLLVSPSRGLGEVPFTLLADGREVAYVTSGTTWRALRHRRVEPGRSVLAVGAALPGARREAESVGNVVLLGPKATEAGLRAAAEKRPRWRAIHFACHALVDPIRPLLSSLALTPEGPDDGRLMAVEVMGLRVSADLVVLSACETAIGEASESEGVMGFARAFMIAGAPRVLVSLWKVDDEATRVLMVKFYELWKTMPAAAALREAQEHVAAQAKWRHPSFWAAWQLWGLPD